MRSPFPMSGDGAVVHRGRPFPDRDGVLDLSQPVALQTGVPGAADRRASPANWASNSFFRTPRVWMNSAPIDRLVGHAAVLVIRMFAFQPARRSAAATTCAQA